MARLAGKGPLRGSRRPRRTGHGKWLGQGKQFEDAHSGWYFPERTHLAYQHGHKVSRDPDDGSLDEPDGAPYRG